MGHCVNLLDSRNRIKAPRGAPFRLWLAALTQIFFPNVDPSLRHALAGDYGYSRSPACELEATDVWHRYASPAKSRPMSLECIQDRYR